MSNISRLVMTNHFVQVLKSHNGHCITMYNAIFQHAVQAWVQVEVVDMNGVPTIAEYDVCGSITASYNHFELDNDSNLKDHCKTTLLKTKDLEKMNVERWKKIQLSRCFIAVAIYASLVIEADLWSSSHLKIAKGKVEFTQTILNLDMTILEEMETLVLG